MNDWQSWTALTVVAITALLFVRRALKRRRSGGGCGGGCGCTHKPR